MTNDRGERGEGVEWKRKQFAEALQRVFVQRTTTHYDEVDSCAPLNGTANGDTATTVATTTTTTTMVNVKRKRRRDVASTSGT